MSPGFLLLRAQGTGQSHSNQGNIRLQKKYEAIEMQDGGQRHFPMLLLTTAPKKLFTGCITSFGVFLKTFRSQHEVYTEHGEICAFGADTCQGGLGERPLTQGQRRGLCNHTVHIWNLPA